jgi:ankyrin repeat protein
LLKINFNLISNFEKDKKVLADYDAVNKELEKLIKILDENSDPAAACTIKKNLITALNYPEQSILMTDINLRTKNNESALSISAKHGFANLIQFLISRGAEKEHFTNEFHTPLSLAVSHNHLNVVEVLFEQWISPNSHTEPQFLHLSPIFNVKSREIAQLLVENDAVTHALYNHKNQSPLTIACQNGYLDVVEFFLEDGLDINHFDNDNKTPIFYADANGHHDIVNFLISQGAQTTSRLLFDNFKVQ